MTNDFDLIFNELNQPLVENNIYGKFGLLKNPFPKAGEPTAEPFYNQNEARSAFRNKLMPFLKGGGNTSDRFLVYGDHRIGKTNFLKYWHKQVIKLRDARAIDGFLPIYLTVVSDNYIDDVHRSLIFELSRSLFPQLFAKLKELNYTTPKDDDLKRAILATLKHSELFSPSEEDILAFAKWFSGERCSSNELKNLGGLFSNIDTASTAINFFHEIISIAKSFNLIKGLIIFLDEFELIFSRTTAPTKRARYLQDLRHFFDTNESSILFVVASTSIITSEFQRDYPALRNRFGNIYELQPIQSKEDAIGYANAYINYGEKLFQDALKNSNNMKEPTPKYLPIISDEEIIPIFEEVQKKPGRFTRLVLC